jgi:hypothetical protein
MAEARQVALGPNAFAKLYEASRYEKISMRTLGPFVQFGFKSNIPPLGGDDAIRMITTDDMEFFVGPGDLIYVSNPGGAATNVQVLASPLPWPLEMLEMLGLRSPRKAEVFFFPNVPVAAVGPPVKAFTADEYTEVAVSIRVSTPGQGQLSFRSSMDANYVVPSAQPFDRFVMAPGDVLYFQGLTGVMDFQMIASPAPWWNKELWLKGSQIAERLC